ncbi:MAG TPA: SMC-Scp complex subunit ScpB [Myxococcales bacterium]|nr:SMC-Scp complex subunit ScpB [Myxococcales bacterium]
MTTEGENGELPLGQDAEATAPAKPAAVTEGGGSAEGAAIGDEQELHEATQTELQQLREAARFATPERAVQVLEALFFAAEKPLDLPLLQETTQFTAELLQGALAELQRQYAPGARGVTLVDLGGRWQLRTHPEVGAYVRRMLQVKPLRLTRAALETLAIVAYRQPITRPEMEDLRGVDCGAITKALLERKLIRILGKKDEPGRPLLYGTSREFLELFNLRDLTQLPTLREFQELSEESRKIVEEEAPAPSVAGISDLAHDPAVAERIAKAGMESERALAQLESAMDAADASARTTAAVLTPPAPPEGSPPAADAPAPEGDPEKGG